MLTQTQYERLQNIQDKPWSGSLNYFRLMKADWDRIEELGYATKRPLPDTGYYGSDDSWEYTITDAGRAELAATKARLKVRNA